MFEPRIRFKNLKDLRVLRTTDESVSSDLSDTYARVVLKSLYFIVCPFKFG